MEKKDEGDNVTLTMKDKVPIETAQMSRKKGLKIFNEGGAMAVKKEIQQLHDCKVMSTDGMLEVTPEQRMRHWGT